MHMYVCRCMWLQTIGIKYMNVPFLNHNDISALLITVHYHIPHIYPILQRGDKADFHRELPDISNDRAAWVAFAGNESPLNGGPPNDEISSSYNKLVPVFCFTSRPFLAITQVLELLIFVYNLHQRHTTNIKQFQHIFFPKEEAGKPLSKCCLQ